MMQEENPQWIDERPALEDLAERCRQARRIAMDTEADSLHSYFHKTCLIQISVDRHTALIDPLALGREGLQPLFKVLADPGVEVLMHGSDYDMRVLDRDFGAHVRGLIDTQEMALILGEQKTGLAALMEQEFGIHLEKKYQRADWGKRPLSKEMLAYAAADTMHLEALVSRLQQRLEKMGRWSWAEQEFRRLEQVRHCEKEEDPCAFERIKGGAHLKGVARDRLFSLHRWREMKARNRDVPPFKIIGNQALLALAGLNEDPTSMVLDSLPGVGPRLARRLGKEIILLVREPSKAPVCRRRRGGVDLRPSQRARLKELMILRDRMAEQLGIQGGLLCSRALLQAIAMTEPFPNSLEALDAAGLKGWRLEVLGELFLKGPGEGRDQSGREGHPV